MEILDYLKVKKFGKGCLVDISDERDFPYDEIATASAPITEADWRKGYDVEKELNIKIPFKNQDGSGSCVGQGWAYYVAVLNTPEIKEYKEVSAKGFYSQIELGNPKGGAYIRDGGKLAVNWGALYEKQLTSYENGKPPSEIFMKDKMWRTPEMDSLAKVLQAKEYRVIKNAVNIDLYAMAIRDNFGTVGGVNGQNGYGWGGLEPRPPEKATWAHCLYFGKFGIDHKGKYIATPNSWGTREIDGEHIDGWQKLREDYFESKNVFNSWTLVDKPNIALGDKLFRTVKSKETSTVWWIGLDGKRRFFFDEFQYESMAGALGLDKQYKNLEIITRKELDIIPRGRPMVIIG